MTASSFFLWKEDAYERVDYDCETGKVRGY